MWTIAETLAQDVIWVTQDGRRMLITEMEQSHRLNTHAYLLCRAAEIHGHVRWLRVRETLRGLRVTDLRSLEGQKVFVEIEMDPERWILATPFMIALDKAIKDYGVEDGEIVDVTYESEIDDESRRLLT